MIQLAIENVCSISGGAASAKAEANDTSLLRRHRNRAELQGRLADHLSSFRGYRGNSLPANSSWLSVFTLTEPHDD
jgi:hypothetical protein